MSFKQGNLKVFNGKGHQLEAYFDLFDQDHATAPFTSQAFPFDTLEETDIVAGDASSALQIAGFNSVNGLESEFSKSTYPNEGATIDIENEDGFIEFMYEDLNVSNPIGYSVAMPLPYSVLIIIEFEEFPKVDSE